MKLDLPAGAEPGSIVLVTWNIGASERAGVVGLEPGPWEGRITGIKGHRVTVHFTYEPTYDPPEETLVIDLENAIDEKYHGIVSDIELKSLA
jgi:hypothetical protein